MTSLGVVLPLVTIALATPAAPSPAGDTRRPVATFLDSPPPVHAAAPGVARAKRPRNFRVSWVGLRGHLGMGTFGLIPFGGAELTLLHLRWSGTFFLDVLNLGGNYPGLLNVGFAFGYPIALGTTGDRCIAVGLHFTWAPLLGGAVPLWSGVLLEYRKEFDGGLDFSTGVRSQYLGFVWTIGFGY